MCSLDAEKGYVQVGAKRNFRDFLLFRVGGRMYRWRVLPFGLASGPRDFSHIVKRVLSILRAQGVRCCFYLDDIIFFASSRAKLLRVRALALRLLHRLGLRVSVKKSLLSPGQLIAHLGMLSACAQRGYTCLTRRSWRLNGRR